MSRTTVRSSRRSLVLLAGTAAGTLLLATGCGAGQLAATSQIQAAIAGVNADAGSIALRNIRVAYPAGGVAATGGTATVLVTFINSSIAAQSLIGVSSPAAGSAELSDTSTAAASAGASPSADSSTGTSASSSASASASSSSGASASSSAGASASASATATTSPATAGIALRIPGQDNVTLTRNGASITLLDLKQDLVSGRTVPITFTFSSGSTATTTVPIAVPSEAKDMPTASPTSGLGESSTGG